MAHLHRRGSRRAAALPVPAGEGLELVPGILGHQLQKDRLEVHAEADRAPALD